MGLAAERAYRAAPEVLLLPLIVTRSGIFRIQAGARFVPLATLTKRANPALLAPSVTLLIVLAVFQLVPRPGIRFYRCSAFGLANRHNNHLYLLGSCSKGKPMITLYH